MPTRRAMLLSPAALAAQQKSQSTDRQYWLDTLTKIAAPVLSNMAAGRLKQTLPVEHHPNSADRPQFTHLEALGRTLTGLAPWLELPNLPEPERSLQSQFAQWARASIAHAVDPASPDYCNFSIGRQPLVDAAFLAHALLRAPNALYLQLPTATKENLLKAFDQTRAIEPAWNNWLLFAATIEAARKSGNLPFQSRPIQTALKLHDDWYKGDGHYGDGPGFHWDYYNSFVIHPMLLDVVRATQSPRYDTYLQRARRFAAIQERLISPEGTYPPIGRSLAYRIGAFQLLSQIALHHQLPAGVHPAQVRAALTAVLRRQFEAPGTFDSNGFLTIGFAGHQPAIGETYISTGSLYLATAGFLHLGLPPDDEFWASPPRPWTSVKLWSGQNLPADHAL